jgi:3-methylcrotonyl-CoA carboxylase alpha subunit
MEITPYYDPMLAKLIVFAPTRDEAFHRLKLALESTVIFGVTTNVDFLRLLIDLPQTRAATFYTRLIDDEIAGWALGELLPSPAILAIAGYYWLLQQRGAIERDPWMNRRNDNWQMGDGTEWLAPLPSLFLISQEFNAAIRFGTVANDGCMLIGVGEECMHVALSPGGEGGFLARVDTISEVVRLQQDGDVLYVHDGRIAHALKARPYPSFSGAAAAVSGELMAPMMGVILKMNVALGEQVDKGAVVAILESMKMEMRIIADCAGTVTAINYQTGQTVERNAVVVVITSG